MNLTVDDVIVVTGGTGMLGRKVVPLLRDRYPARVVALSSKDFDLVEQADVIRMFEVNTPTVVVHLAGYVGGIGVNRQYPADFFYRNTMMTTSVIHYASQHGVKKLVTAIGGCSYPAAATSPIHEDRMWDGYPQSENAPYSVAKKLALVQVEAYRRQYGLPAAVFIPGNVYGEHDNFSLAAAHVVPAMVRRFYEAMRNGDSQVPLWGSGSASRDFVYVGDVAAVVPFFLETVDSPDPVNISSGVGISIRDLATTIKEIVGYDGEIIWDRTAPEGHKVRTFDVSRMRSLGLSCDTSLYDGLVRTIEWFRENYANGNVRL